MELTATGWAWRLAGLSKEAFVEILNDQK